ncbi:MAG: DUF177 domain-containing protein [Bacteroidales bacterium]|nr:DUF177 domain-containing protein [Bacteroidales bacterium]
MDTLSRFKISLADLPADGYTCSWHLDDTFFAALDEQLIRQGCLDATLRVNRKSGHFELLFHVEGEVSVPCDRCLEPMSQPVSAEDTIEVHLGERFDDDGEIITVPETDAQINVAWNLYETIALAIPIYHVHPDGQCPEEVSQFFTSPSDDTSGNAPADARWEALRSLLDDKH